MGKKSSSGAPGLPQRHGCLWRHHSRREVGKRGEGRGGKDNRATSNTLCALSLSLSLSLSFSLPWRQFYQRACYEALKAFQQELCDCTHVLVTCTCTKSSVQEFGTERERGASAWFRSCTIYERATGEQAATVHLTLSGGDAELELLEGGETGSSSLYTSLFKGTIKVWQKCQCCRQGTGLWMSVLLRSTSRASLPRRQEWVERGGRE